jgi:phosphoribosylformylglycinamidine synthase subunit PurSL
MGEEIGAVVELDKVPLKYAGLRYDEIWISEAQERMVLAVPPKQVDQLLKLAASEDVEATVIGTFGTPDHELILIYRGQEVGRLSMEFLHHGLPMPTRRAVVVEGKKAATEITENTEKNSLTFSRSDSVSSELSVAPSGPRTTGASRLLAALAHPNIASKHWIIRQYDHEVQGGSVIKPLTGPLQRGPSDAAVIRPKLDSFRGVAIGCGLAPNIEDPYEMALAAIDEAIRNVVAVGADPDRIALLDNFCWPSCEDELTMGALVRACEACRDAALAYGTPFISGKDSLNNQFTNSETGEVIRIPNTLLISAIGIIQDVRRCVTMDLKLPGSGLWLMQPIAGADLRQRAAFHRFIAGLMRSGIVVSCHDCSDGGPIAAAAEMCIASGLGLDCTGDMLDERERIGAYLVEIQDESAAEAQIGKRSDILRATKCGRVTTHPRLRFDAQTSFPVEDLARAWRGSLDW